LSLVWPAPLLMNPDETPICTVMLRTNFTRLAAVALLVTLAKPAFADVDQQTPTFYVMATGGYSIYKSEMVESNDTSFTTSYGLGVWAGNQRNVGMALRRESSAFTFALNESTLALDWQDTLVRYRFGPVYFGVALTSSTWLVDAPPDADQDGKLDQDATPEPYLDMASNGYGFNTGAMIPFGRRNFAYVDVTYAASGVVRETPIAPETGENAGVPTEKDIALGPRMDLDLGGSIGLTKNVLDVLVGFKYRTYGLTVDGTEYKEQLNTTYVGLSAGWQF
jgi:hypothetical protein